MAIRNKYLVELIAFLSYVLFAMAWVGGTAYMDQIMAAMAVTSLASASFLSGAVTLAKIVGTFMAAGCAVKFGLKGAFLVSALFVGLGWLTPYAANYEILLASRFLMGLGGALMVVYFNPIVLRWFSPSERPVLNGLNAVAFNVGTALILWFINDITQWFGGWQSTLAAFSIASLVLAGAWLLVDNSGASESQGGQAAAEEYSYLDGLKDRFNWTYSLTYSGLLSFYICLFTFYPKAGISQSKWVIGFGIIGTLAGILYSRKQSLRLPVIRWSGLMIILAIIGTSFSPNVLLTNISSMVLGFFIFLPVTALVTLPQELPGMNGKRITVIFSLFYSISYLVATLVLWLFGWLVDSNQGDFGPSFILITIVSSSFFIGSFFLPETGEEKLNELATQGS